MHCAGVPKTAPQLDGALGGAGALHTAHSGPARLRSSGRLRSQISQGAGAQSRVRRTPGPSFPAPSHWTRFTPPAGRCGHACDSSPGGCWRSALSRAHAALQTPGATAGVQQNHAAGTNGSGRVREGREAKCKLPVASPGPPLRAGLAKQSGRRPALSMLLGTAPPLALGPGCWTPRSSAGRAHRGAATLQACSHPLLGALDLAS